jgi:membrane-anchored protein YejM (alkaline phosphatase superfamily)
MTIEIHRPELEARIIERMKSGEFKDIEDVIMQALMSAPFPAQDAATGADLVAAMQASPYREIDIQPLRNSLPVRDVTF